MDNWVKEKRAFIEKNMLSSSTTWGRSTTHPKFDSTGVRTHDLQIMTVYFMSLKNSHFTFLHIHPSGTSTLTVMYFDDLYHKAVRTKQMIVYSCRQYCISVGWKGGW